MRSLSSTSQSVLVASGSIPTMILLLTMETTPVVRLNSTSATVSYQGNDYLGAGNFGSIDSIADVPGDQGGLKFTLSGVPTDTISLALQDAPNTKGARVTLQLALLYPANKAIADVLQLFRGFVDQMPITYGPRMAEASRPASASPARTAGRRSPGPSRCATPTTTNRSSTLATPRGASWSASRKSRMWAGRRGSAMRLPDWQSRLAAVMREAQARPFAWGSHDCATFAATCVVAVTGVDRIADVRAARQSELQAARLLERLGGLRAAIGERLGAPLASVALCPAG